jgi:hypothetical protein
MTDAWLVKDKKWMKKRKAEWKVIKKSLDLCRLTRKEIKCLKDYFLKGTESDKVGFDENDIDWVPVIFKLWFHPEQSEKNWARLCDKIWLRDFVYSSQLFNEGACEDHGNGFQPPYGFMGGLEPKVLKFLLGNGKGTRKVIVKEPRDYSFVEQELKFERYMINIRSLIITSNDWLCGIGCKSPFNLCQYLIDYFFDILPSELPEWLDKTEDIESNKIQAQTLRKQAWEKKISDAEKEEFWIKSMLLRLVVFVSPCGLLNEDTPQKRFAEKFLQELKQRKLPPYFQKYLDEVHEQEIRQAWSKTKIPHKYFDHDDEYLNIEHACNKEPITDAIQQIISIANELGFTKEEYAEKNLTKVDITCLVPGETRESLGYNANEKIPAMAYTIAATTKMTDTTEEVFKFDLLEILHSADCEWSFDTPIFLWLNRPKEFFDNVNQPGIMTFSLNKKLLYRTIKARCGLNIFFDDSVDEYYEPIEQRFRCERLPILMSPEYDLSLWED